MIKLREKKMVKMEYNGKSSLLLLLLFLHSTGSDGNQDSLLSFDYIQEKYSQDCPFIARGGKPEPCPDGDCDCFQKDGIGCIFGICVCLYREHLVFDHPSKCYNIINLHHYENMTKSELRCPRMCTATNESNTCIYPSMKNLETGSCECPDGTPVIPKFTKHLTLNLTVSQELCAASSTPLTTSPPTVSIEII